MKKLLSTALVLFLAMLCTLSVSADVIFEPDDDFYSKYSSECQLLERSFIATETVYTVNEPNSSIVYGKLNAGDKVYISYIYEDSEGIVWGLISFTDGVNGWLPMGYLEVIYDNTSFAEEFGDKFNYDTDDLKLPETDTIVFWAYPGSDSFYEMTCWDDSYLDMGFSRSYTDENGIIWGYVGYFYGMDGWVCIDDPSSTDVTGILERGTQSLYPNSVLGDDSTVKKGGLTPIWIAVISVAALCAVTAVIIAVVIRKKKS